MGRIGIIGTTSLAIGDGLGEVVSEVVVTRWGDVPVRRMAIDEHELVLLQRPGFKFPLEPGRINFRANTMAFVELGVTVVVATCTGGSVRESLGPGTLVNLDQFIDFTRYRPPTLFDNSGFRFTDMTNPYCVRVRRALDSSAAATRIELMPTGCYVGMDGPRYETAAEARMFALLGGDLLGHTGTTEAVMAREAGLCYGAVATISNYGPGLNSSTLSAADMHAESSRHSERVGQLITAAARRLLGMEEADLGECDCRQAGGEPQISQWNRLP